MKLFMRFELFDSVFLPGTNICNKINIYVSTVHPINIWYADNKFMAWRQALSFYLEKPQTKLSKFIRRQ